jgi:two-component system, OmpR family, phosphate regulon sensor histidine kinase PhoR
MRMPFGKDSLELQSILQAVLLGKAHFPITVPPDDEHTILVKILNTLFEKDQTEISALKQKVLSLEGENATLATHAQKLTEQKLAITAKEKQTTEVLTSSQKELEKIQKLMSNIHEGIVALDENYKVLFFNKAAERITGYTKEFAVEHPISEIITLFDKTELLTPSTYSSDFSKENLKMVGNGKNAYVNFASIRLQDTDTTTYILSLEDVTAEQEIERLKLDFVSMAAHELRTPLTTIRGYVSFLQDPKVTQKLTSDETDYLKRVSISAIRLNELIENLLTISKIEQGKMTIDPEVADIVPLMSKLAEEFQMYAEYKKLELEFIAPPTTGLLVLMDKTRIEEVLINLISNAINYTTVGKITLTIKQTSDKAVIGISDTGIGIPKELQSQLFTKYFRVQGNTSGSKGTGLGLYICKTIIDAHHGEIWVESTPDKGSTFFFSLPLSL